MSITIDDSSSLPPPHTHIPTHDLITFPSIDSSLTSSLSIHSRHSSTTSSLGTLSPMSISSISHVHPTHINSTLSSTSDSDTPTTPHGNELASPISIRSESPPYGLVSPMNRMSPRTPIQRSITPKQDEMITMTLPDGIKETSSTTTTTTTEVSTPEAKPAESPSIIESTSVTATPTDSTTTSTPSTKSATPDTTSNITPMDSDPSTSLLLPKTFNDLSLSSRTSPRPPLSHSSHSTSHLEMRRHSHSHIRPHGHVRLSPRPHDDGHVYHMRHPSPPVMTRPLSQSHVSRSHSGTPSSEGSPRTRRSDSPSSLSYSPISPISSSSSLQATARYSSRTHSGKTSRSRSTSPDTAHHHHHRSTRQPISINAGTSSSPGQSPTISSPNLSARVRDGRRSHSSSPSQSPSLSPSPPLPKSIRIDCGPSDDHSTIEIESYRGRHHDERSRDITNLSIDTTSEDIDSPRRHRHKFRINTSMVSPSTTTFQKPTLNLQLATQSQVFRSLKPLHLDSSSSPNMSIIPHPNSTAATELENESGSHLQARNKIEYFSRHCSEITDFLFVGGKKVAENYELLASKGITHIVNCAGDICDNYFPDKITYKRMFLLDSASEDIICVMYPVFDFIDECRKKNGKALIHCQQGVSRSTVLCIAYLMYLNNKDYDDMYQMVRARRGVCRPNVGFMCQLLAWRKRVTGKNSKPKCLYRVAPHCSRDRHLVTKWVDRVDNSSLDARGLFLLHTPDALYIWIGSQCRRENEFMVEAQRLITKLQAIEHAPSTVYILRQTPDEKRELSDGQLWDDAPQAAGFWQVLGGNKILKTINPKFNEDYMEESAMKTMPTTTSTMMTQQPVTITTGHTVARASPRRSGPPATPKNISTSPQSHMMTKPETPKALSLNAVSSPTSRPVITRDRSTPIHSSSMITVPGQRPKGRTGVPVKSMSVVMTQPPLGHKIVQGHRSMKSTPMGLISMGSPPHQHHSQHSYIHHTHPHTISPSSPMHHAQHTPSRSRAGSGTRRDSVSGATPPNLSLNLAPSMMTSAPGSARKDSHPHPHPPTHPHEGTSMSGLSYSADEDTDTTDTNDTDTDTDLFHRRTTKMSILPLGDIDHTTDDGEYADAENSGNEEEDVSMEDEESEMEEEIDGDQERRNSKSLKRRSHTLKSDRTSHSIKRTSPTTTATVHHKSPVLRGVSKSPQPMSSRTSGVKLKLNTMITDDFGTRRRSSSSGQHGSISHRRNYDDEKHHHHHGVHPIDEHGPTTHDYFDPQSGMSSHRHYTHPHHISTQTSHPQARGKPRAMSAVSPSSAQRAIIAMQLHAPNASSRSSSRSPVPRSPHHSSNVPSPSHPHMQPAASPQPRPSLSRPGSSSSGYDGSARGPHRGSFKRVVTSPTTNGVDDADVHSSGDEYDTPQYRVMPPVRRPSQDHDGDLSDSSTASGEKAILYDYPACTPVEMFDSDDLIPDQIFILCFRPTKIPSAISTPVANSNSTTPSSPSLLAPPSSTSSVELHVWLGEDVVIPETYPDVRSYATHIAQDFVQRQHITGPYSVTAQESGHETERFWDGFADG